MTADVVIRAEGLGKRYLIGHQAERERYTALRDVIARSAVSLAQSVRDLAHGRPTAGFGGNLEEFWALKDVNFEVRRGEVVGIIGRNGAGKSTLLKVLSRITEPTEGQVTIKGRVGSLLEVGTGFHPELTGRENIYLNGAILGMSRAEIRAKFDEIVTFAEVEKFLDTPVKRYSSGMYVRLAFAVAAHLEPEILIVDEVLAVGDVQFQKKCLGKMHDVAQDGRTVLFVSHNISSIKSLCSASILMQDGGIQGQFQTAQEGVELYITNFVNSAYQWWNNGSQYQNEYMVPIAIVNVTPSDLAERYLTVQVHCDVKIAHPNLNVGLALKLIDGQSVLITSPRDRMQDSFGFQTGLNIIECKIPISILNTVNYVIEIIGVIHNQEYLWPPGEGPTIQIPSLAKIGVSRFWGARDCAIAPFLDWKISNPT